MTLVIVLGVHGYQQNKIQTQHITLVDIDKLSFHMYSCFTENMAWYQQSQNET